MKHAVITGVVEYQRLRGRYAASFTAGVSKQLFEPSLNMGILPTLYPSPPLTPSFGF